MRIEDALTSRARAYLRSMAEEIAGEIDAQAYEGRANVRYLTDLREQIVDEVLEKLLALDLPTELEWGEEADYAAAEHRWEVRTGR